jgi:hypothetical protein
VADSLNRQLQVQQKQAITNNMLSRMMLLVSSLMRPTRPWAWPTSTLREPAKKLKWIGN